MSTNKSSVSGFEVRLGEAEVVLNVTMGAVPGSIEIAKAINTSIKGISPGMISDVKLRVDIDQKSFDKINSNIKKNTNFKKDAGFQKTTKDISAYYGAISKKVEQQKKVIAKNSEKVQQSIYTSTTNPKATQLSEKANIATAKRNAKKRETQIRNLSTKAVKYDKFDTTTATPTQLTGYTNYIKELSQIENAVNRAQKIQDAYTKKFASRKLKNQGIQRADLDQTKEYYSEVSKQALKTQKGVSAAKDQTGASIDSSDIAKTKKRISDLTKVKADIDKLSKVKLTNIDDSYTKTKASIQKKLGTIGNNVSNEKELYAQYLPKEKTPVTNANKVAVAKAELSNQVQTEKENAAATKQLAEVKSNVVKYQQLLESNKAGLTKSIETSSKPSKSDFKNLERVNTQMAEIKSSTSGATSKLADFNSKIKTLTGSGFSGTSEERVKDLNSLNKEMKAYNSKILSKTKVQKTTSTNLSGTENYNNSVYSADIEKTKSGLDAVYKKANVEAEKLNSDTLPPSFGDNFEQAKAESIKNIDKIKADVLKAKEDLEKVGSIKASSMTDAQKATVTQANNVLRGTSTGLGGNIETLQANNKATGYLTDTNSTISSLHSEMDMFENNRTTNYKKNAQYLVESDKYKKQLEKAESYYQDKFSSKVVNGNVSQINDTDSIKEMAAANDYMTNLRKQYNTFVKNSGIVVKKSFASRVKDMVGKYGSWQIAIAGMRQAIALIKTIGSNVVLLDKAMTGLKKVTNESDQGYVNFFENAKKQAGELQSTVSAVIDSTASFSKLGYNLNDASKLANSAIKYSNVGDDVGGVSNATDSIVSTMKAYDLDPDKSESIVDKFNEVGNKYATSSGDIGIGLQKSAAALHSAGNDLDESIALFTTGQTVVQDASSMGTVLKTLSMRVRGSKTDMEELGLDTDNMSTSTSKLRSELKGLTGVDIMVDDDTYKSTFEMVDEFSKVWGNLSDITQANVLEKLAGKRNANALAALIENGTLLNEVLDTSKDSFGSAEKEQQVWGKSVEGLNSKLEGSVQGFSTSVLDNSVIKFFLNSADKIITFLTAITDKVGGLWLALAPIMAYQAVKGNFTSFLTDNGIVTKAGEKQKEKVKLKATKPTVLDTIKTNGVNKDSLKQGVGIAKDEITTSAKKVGSTLKDFGKGIGASLLASFAISGVIAAVGFTLNTIDKKIGITSKTIKAQRDQVISDSDTATKTYDTNMTKINGMYSQFKELSKGIGENGENIGLTNANYEKYNSLVNQLVDINPSLVQGYTDEGQAIIDKNTALKESIDLQEEQKKTALDKYTSFSSGKEILKGTNVDIGEVGKNVNASFQKIAKYGTGMDDYYDPYPDTELYTPQAQGAEVTKNHAVYVKNIQNADISAEAKSAAMEELNTIQTLMTDIDNATLENQKWLSSRMQNQGILNDKGESTDLSEFVPKQYMSAYSEGLKIIAQDTSLSAEQMSSEASNLAKDFQQITKAGTKSGNEFQTMLDKSKAAKDKFSDSAKNTDDLNEYNGSIVSLDKEMGEFIKNGDYSDDVNAMFEKISDGWTNFAENMLSLKTVFDPLEESINNAATAKSRFDTVVENGDYYTGTEGMNGIYEESTSDENKAGNGSKTFWEGAKDILGKDRLEELKYNKTQVTKELTSRGKNTGSGTEATKDLVSLLTGNTKALNAIKGVKVTADTFNIPTDKMAEVADILNVSDDYLATLISSARQFLDLDLSDSIQNIISAIQNSDYGYTNTITNKTKDGKPDTKNPTKVMTIGNYDAIQAESGLSGKEFYEESKKLEKNNVDLLSAGDDKKETQKTFKNAGWYDNKNGKVDSEKSIQGLLSMKFTETDAKKIFDKASKGKGNTDYLEDGQNFSDYWDKISAPNFDLIDANVTLTTAIEDLTTAVTGNTTAKYQKELDNKYSDKDYKTAEKVESGAGKDSLSNNVENKASVDKTVTGLTSEKQKLIDLGVKDGDPALDSINDKLKKYTKLSAGYKKEIDKVLGTDKVETFKKSLDGTKFTKKQKSDLVDTFTKIQDGSKVSTKKVNALKSAISKVKSKHPVISTSITAKATTIGAKAFNIITTGAKNIKKTIGEIFVSLTHTKENKDKPGSWAKGGTSKGGISLTGEEGPEIVWSKKGGYSYIVGQDNPEFVNLNPGDSVITAPKTRKILSTPLGKKIFKSHVGGVGMQKYIDDDDKVTSTSKAKAEAKSKSKSKSESAKKKSDDKDVKDFKAKYDAIMTKYQFYYDWHRITAKKHYDLLLALNKKYWSKLTDAEKREAKSAAKEVYMEYYTGNVAAYNDALERNTASEAGVWKALKENYDKNLKGKGSQYYDEKKTAKGEIADAALAAYEARKTDLDEKLEDELVSWTSYYKKINEAETKYLSGSSRLIDDRLEKRKEILDKAVEQIENSISKAETVISDNTLFDMWGDTTPLKVWTDELTKLEKMWQNGEMELLAYTEQRASIERSIAQAQASYDSERKQNIDTYLEMVKSMVQQEGTDHINALQDELTAYQKIIDKKKEILEIDETERQYNSDIEDSTEDLSDLRDKAQLLKLDDSREGQAQFADIMDQISDKQKDADTIQREHADTVRTQAFDDLYDSLDEKLTADVESIQDFLDNNGEVLDESLTRISEINEDGNTLSEKLLAWNKQYGTGLDTTIDVATSNFRDAVSELGDSLGEGTTLRDLYEALTESSLTSGTGYGDSYSDVSNPLLTSDITPTNFDSTQKYTKAQYKSYLDKYGTNTKYTDTNKAVYSNLLGQYNDKDAQKWDPSWSDKDYYFSSSGKLTDYIFSTSDKRSNAHNEEAIDTINTQYSEDYKYSKDKGAYTKTSSGIYEFADGTVGWDPSWNSGKMLKFGSKSALAKYILKGKRTDTHNKEALKVLDSISGYSGYKYDSKTNKFKISSHHTGLASGFTGDGASLKQNEVYSKLLNNELVLNKEDQMNIGAQLELINRISDSLGAMPNTSTINKLNSKGVNINVSAPVTINGNADDNTVKILGEFGDDIANKTLGKLDAAFNKRGYF